MLLEAVGGEQGRVIGYRSAHAHALLDEGGCSVPCLSHFTARKEAQYSLQEAGWEPGPA